MKNITHYRLRSWIQRDRQRQETAECARVGEMEGWKEMGRCARRKRSKQHMTLSAWATRCAVPAPKWCWHLSRGWTLQCKAPESASSQTSLDIHQCNMKTVEVHITEDVHRAVEKHASDRSKMCMQSHHSLKESLDCRRITPCCFVGLWWNNWNRNSGEFQEDISSLRTHKVDGPHLYVAFLLSTVDGVCSSPRKQRN